MKEEKERYMMAEMVLVGYNQTKEEKEHCMKEKEHCMMAEMVLVHCSFVVFLLL